MTIALPILALLLSGAVAAAEPDRSADRAEIERGERAWGQAYVTGDVATADRLLHERFVGVGPRGALYDKTQALGFVREGPNITSDRVEDLTVRFFGDTAVAQAREVEVGPPPEFKPEWRVFTDTWVKEAGRWRIIAAEDLDPGAPTSAEHRADEQAIRALRARSNAAIAAHDLAAFTPVFADDAAIVTSDGSSSVGIHDLKSRFAKDFADPAFIAYVRTPERVSVAENGVRAVEHGTWTALKKETRYSGDYTAHWMKSDGGWRIRGELYVKLRCTGPLCTP